jgi:hypothetical protein
LASQAGLGSVELVKQWGRGIIGLGGCGAVKINLYPYQKSNQGRSDRI